MPQFQATIFIAVLVQAPQREHYVEPTGDVRLGM